ncbi:acyl-CoA dehydratase activase-related protein [Halonatronum saccharophilum]|uniref:acyl-CoA dehydratase activase-related protein n=1 Tax=Halonatronum saccharophilum TaxID=150060 RepID=UPI0005507FA5|nr:acyl-CoA dehydratase activase-related protein [Halonatronum saccharophilum]
MSFKIGIPKALLYYKYYRGWNKFFEELGCEVVNSDKSTKDIVDKGVSLSVDEACFPVKLFLGHVDYLKDKVDYLFIPRVISVQPREYLCPKFMGLPDMVRHNIDRIPPIIDTTINMRSRKRDLLKSAFEVGDILGKGYIEVTKALFKALRELRRYKKEMLDKSHDRFDYKIGLLGHEYIIYDPHVSMNLIKKLRKMGVDVITSEMVDDQILEEQAKGFSKDMFWTLSKSMLGSAYHFFERDDIDGIIQLTAFGCGPDSLVGEMVERESKRRRSQPFISLNLDEHTGEAGLVTRLEAFIDMIRWEGA